MRKDKIGYKTNASISFEGYAFDTWCKTNEPAMTYNVRQNLI